MPSCKELRRACDEIFGRMMLHIDTTLPNPVHRQVAKRVVCSMATGGNADTVADVLKGVHVNLDHENLLTDEFIIEPSDMVWIMFEGLQYSDFDDTYMHMSPVFEESNLSGLFRCIVDCLKWMRSIEETIGEGGRTLPPYKSLIIMNHIRAIGGLPPRKRLALTHTCIDTIAVTQCVIRKMRTTTLWNRMRVYVQCLHHVKADTASGGDALRYIADLMLV